MMGCFDKLSPWEQMETFLSVIYAFGIEETNILE